MNTIHDTPPPDQSVIYTGKFGLPFAAKPNRWEVTGIRQAEARAHHEDCWLRNGDEPEAVQARRREDFAYWKAEADRRRIWTARNCAVRSARAVINGTCYGEPWHPTAAEFAKFGLDA